MSVKVKGYTRGGGWVKAYKRKPNVVKPHVRGNRGSKKG